jgi:hypothetical protein
MLCLAIAFAVVAAGCGGGGDGDGNQVASLDGNNSAASQATAKKRTDPATAMRAFARCMRAHGVQMADPKIASDGKGFGITIGPGPGGNGRPPNEKKLNAAQKACQHFMDEAEANGGKRPDPAQEAKARRQALAFARCMREHGIDMPDPTFEGGGKITQKMKGSADRPAFEAANKACMKSAGMKGGGFSVSGPKGGSQ